MAERRIIAALAWAYYMLKRSRTQKVAAAQMPQPTADEA